MAELTLRFYDIGLRPLRTETMTVADESEAVALARSRLRTSRFKAASVHLDGAFLVQIGRRGAYPEARDLSSNSWRRADEEPCPVLDARV